MAAKNETISRERYWKALKDANELYCTMEQIHSLAEALASMADFKADKKWSVLARMIRDLCEEAMSE